MAERVQGQPPGPRRRKKARIEYEYVDDSEDSDEEMVVAPNDDGRATVKTMWDVALAKMDVTRGSLAFGTIFQTIMKALKDAETESVSDLLLDEGRAREAFSQAAESGARIYDPSRAPAVLRLQRGDRVTAELEHDLRGFIAEQLGALVDAEEFRAGGDQDDDDEQLARCLETLRDVAVQETARYASCDAPGGRLLRGRRRRRRRRAHGHVLKIFVFFVEHLKLWMFHFCPGASCYAPPPVLARPATHTPGVKLGDVDVPGGPPLGPAMPDPVPSACPRASAARGARR